MMCKSRQIQDRGIVTNRSSDRHMHPESEHCVKTVTESLFFGCHYYSIFTMETTMIAIVEEHHFGEVITNTEHVTCYFALFKLVGGYVDNWHDPFFEGEFLVNAFIESDV